MKILACFLGFISVLMGFLAWIKTGSGLTGGIAWLPRLMAGAWTPLWAALGGLAVLLGLIKKDKIAMLAGAGGAALATAHIFKVTARHGDFGQAFGPDWKSRIAPGLPARYRLIQPKEASLCGQKDVIIGVSSATATELLCDLWEPPQGAPRSGLAVIYFHAGAWQAFDKDFLTRPLFERMTARGHVVMDAAYSLAPAAQLNDMLGDVKQAIVWLKKHADGVQVNPDRIVLMGGSGGAHLALMGAYAGNHPAFQRIYPGEDMRVRGVISLFGMTDMSAFFEEYGRSTRKQPLFSTEITADLQPRVYDRTWLDKFYTRSRIFPAYRHSNMPGGALLLVNLLGGTLKEIPEVFRQASPLTHVGPHCPPTLQVMADDDFMVDVSHGRRLHQALQQAGVPSVLAVYPHSVHGFNQYFGLSQRIAPASQAFTHDVEMFLALLV